MPCFLLLLWAYREKTDAKPLYAKQHGSVTSCSHSFYCDQMLFQTCSKSSLVPASGQYLGGEEAGDFRTVALVGAKMLGEWKVIEAKKTTNPNPKQNNSFFLFGFYPFGPLSLHFCFLWSISWFGFWWALWRQGRPSLAPCRMRRCMERTQESSWYLVLVWVYSFIRGRVLRRTLPFSYGKGLIRAGRSAVWTNTVWDQPVSKQELG